MTAMTRQRLVKAKLMRERGYHWTRIAQRLNCSYDTVRRALDPEWAERRKQGVNEARRARNLNGSSTRYIQKLSVPDEVIAVRDAAAEHKLTINQLILGDPPPGRSALDMKS